MTGKLHRDFYLSIFTIIITCLILPLSSDAQTITGFTPDSITAGTGSVLTINGSGFGTSGPDSSHYVEFTSADVSDAPGFSSNPIIPDQSEYISWTDNQIKVKVPSHAGTGIIRIVSGANTVSSNNALIINYAIYDVEINGIETPMELSNANNAGGYTFHLEYSFNADTAARRIFIQAMNMWKCAIGVNWVLGPPTGVNVVADDGINVIKFDTTGDDFNEQAVAGETYYFGETCGNIWKITGVDIVFNSQYSSYLGMKLPLHELGHAVGLGHSNDPYSVMWTGGGSEKWDGILPDSLSTDDIKGGKYEMALSTVNNNGCSSPMIPLPPGSCDQASPTITSFYPNAAGPGDTVTISGTNLTNTLGVSFGGVSANSYLVISPNTAKAVVGVGSSGPISLATPGGITDLAGFTFIPWHPSYIAAPIIHYNSPLSYNIKASITSLIPVNTGGSVPATIYGQVSTLAGGTTPGDKDGMGTAAKFNSPRGLAMDTSGNIYVVDGGNNQIREISQNGNVTTFSGTGFLGNTDGTASEASFNAPFGVAVDIFGNVYVADTYNNLIRKISSKGVVSSISVNGLWMPFCIAIDNSSGNLYVGDYGNLIRKMALNGSWDTLAGNGMAGSSNGIGTSARFHSPWGLGVDGVGNIYVGDAGNNLIRKITPSGVVTTFAGSGKAGSANGVGTQASFNTPSGIAVDRSGNVYVSDANNSIIRKITPSGLVTTLAGKINNAGMVNGLGTNAEFLIPNGLAIDKYGNLYVADEGNNTIRKIILTGYTISPALPAGLKFDSTTGIISGTPTALSPATTYTITAYNAGGSSTATINITVLAAKQTIAFPNLSTHVYGDADFDPKATASSGLPVTYASSNSSVATIVNGKIHIVGAGTVIITASQAGNSDYVKASDVSQSLVISPAVLTIKANNQTKMVGQPNPSLTISYSGFVNGEGPANLTKPPMITTSAVNSSTAGTYIINVSGAADADYTFIYVSGVLTITSIPTQTISFSKIAAHVYGDSDLDPEATSSSGLPVTYTSSNSTVATIVNDKIHIVGAGTSTITASQSGSSGYAKASDVSQSLVVSPAVLTITANNRTKVVGQSNPTLTVTYSGFVNGDNPAKLTKLPVASTSATNSSPVGAYTIKVSGASATNYTFKYISGTLTVTPPPPTITSFNPVNAITGTTVTVTGTYLTGATAVSFGGTPAGSYKVISSTSITAVVGDGASGNVLVITPYGTGKLEGFNFIFTLPPTNYTVSTNSATCIGSSDGAIKIAAKQKLNYIATIISGNTDTSSYSFTDSLAVNNLSAGTYQVCITIQGEQGYEQCYNLTITQPKPLSAYAVVNPSQHTITLNMNGAHIYYIQLGHEFYTTSHNEITLPLTSKEHLLMISTDKACQGIVRKQINIPGEVMSYPNPFRDYLNIDFGKDNVAHAIIKITELSTGRVVYDERVENQSGTMQLNTSDFSAGMYALDIYFDHVKYAFKIVKVEK